MLKKLFFILSALFCFISCCPHLRPQPAAPQPHAHPSTDPILKTVYIDYHFTVEERNTIISALKSWECSTGHIIQLNIIYNASDTDYDLSTSKNNIFIWKTDEKNIDIIEADRVLPQPDPTTKHYVIGLFMEGSDIDSPKILLVMDRIVLYRDFNALKTVALHEFGHALLLHMPHNKDKNSVMYSDVVAGSKTITDVDIATFCGRYHCDPHQLHICDI